jgi:hypothetical protein
MTFNINTLSRNQLIAEIVNSEIEFKQNLDFLLCDYFAAFSTEDLKERFMDFDLHLPYIHADSYIETDKNLMGPL